MPDRKPKKGSKYTPEVIRYCRENALKIAPADLMLAANKEFNAGIKCSVETFKCVLRAHKIKYKTEKRKVRPGLKRKRKYTPEMMQWLKDNVSGCRFPVLAEKFNRHFGTNITAQKIRSVCIRCGMKNGLPFSDSLMIGESYIDNFGAELIKVSMTGTFRQQFKYKHRLIWEAANGPVPEGHVVIFADRDKSNFALDNLLLVPRGIFISMVKSGFFYDNADFTKTAVAVFKHAEAVKTAMKRLEEKL